MKAHNILHSAKQTIQRLVPAKVIQSRLHKRTFQQFADKIGLVYFGYVDQRNDEHSLIRGLTVSTKHRDNHYCIGSFDAYDVTLVERVDTIRFPGKPAKTHNWIIMTFDLHRSVDLPHVFLGLFTHGDTFYAHLFTKFSNFAKIHVGALGHYDHAFLNRYTIYAKPEQALSTERLFNPTIAKTIADQFGALTIEISDGALYLYAEHHRPTAALLDKMLTRGVWLAKNIDAQEDEVRLGE